MPTCNTQLGVGALPCDAWHHYYHYQASAQYLWLAETLCALGREEEAQAAYTKAVFQDHRNEEALLFLPPPSIRGRAGVGVSLPSDENKQNTPTLILPLIEGGGDIKYDKHPSFDLEFLSLTGQLPDAATEPHDHAAAVFAQGDISQALVHLERALAANPTHSNSHFLQGKCHFTARDYETALADFREAVRLSHIGHDLYHRLASAEHVKRGREFAKRGEFDLAVSDFTKALDLHRGNKEALKARAETYRAKGNEKLAEEDEQKLALMP